MKTALWMDNFRKMGTELECKLFSLIIKNKKLFTIVNNSIQEVKNVDEKIVEMFLQKKEKPINFILSLSFKSSVPIFKDFFLKLKQKELFDSYIF